MLHVKNGGGQALASYGIWHYRMNIHRKSSHLLLPSQYRRMGRRKLTQGRQEEEGQEKANDTNQPF